MIITAPPVVTVSRRPSSEALNIETQICFNASTVFFLPLASFFLNCFFGYIFLPHSLESLVCVWPVARDQTVLGWMHF